MLQLSFARTSGPVHSNSEPTCWAKKLTEDSSSPVKQLSRLLKKDTLGWGQWGLWFLMALRSQGQWSSWYSISQKAMRWEGQCWLWQTLPTHSPYLPICGRGLGGRAYCACTSKAGQHPRRPAPPFQGVHLPVIQCTSTTKDKIGEWGVGVRPHQLRQAATEEVSYLVERYSIFEALGLKPFSF